VLAQKGGEEQKTPVQTSMHTGRMENLLMRLELCKTLKVFSGFSFALLLSSFWFCFVPPLLFWPFARHNFPQH